MGTGPQARLYARTVLRTGDDPGQCLAAAVAWLRHQEQVYGKLQALGMASFGPVDLATDSPTYGSITSTPKPGWANTDLLRPLRQGLGGIPLGFDTDVNGAALGEYCWGAATGLDDFVYITLGTGIGAGGMARGQLLHGLVHPEMGHMHLPRLAGDTFGGVCPYHGACWEGLCSGPAIQARTGMPAEQLPPNHPAWPLVAHYVAYALVNILCVLSPRKIILGGSVSKAGQLGAHTFFQWIRANVQTICNAYIRSPALLGSGIHSYIVPPMLGDDAGVCGALALGQGALA